jgi:hypothetical protein
MSLSSSDLAHELAVMSDVFPDLAERLDLAAEQLRARGAPLPGSLIDELLSWRRDFDAFRDRVLALATALDVAIEPEENGASLQQLAAVLHEIGEAEIQQVQREESRRRALAALDKVIALEHATDPDYRVLRVCQEQARELREAIAAGAWNELPAETEPLAEGEHALAHLLALIEDQDELSDELWASYSESVGLAYGTSLVAAAARSKLVLPTAAAAASA